MPTLKQNVARIQAQMARLQSASYGHAEPRGERTAASDLYPHLPSEDERRKRDKLDDAAYLRRHSLKDR
jgi:hypothetical protein